MIEYYYNQCAGFNSEGKTVGIWVKVKRSFLVDSTFSERDLEDMELLFNRTNAKSLEIHTMFHGYKLVKVEEDHSGDALYT